MYKSIKEILKEFGLKGVNYLNKEKLTHLAGKYDIELSSRTISDVIEKHIR